jgi:Polyketide cyclase / dehydrase and lipid transport
MKPIGVSTVIDIARPGDEVAAYVSDPDNAPSWHANIERVAWQTGKPLATGTRIDFVGSLLGSDSLHTYEVIDFVPDERLVMATAEGPFPVETTYTWTGLPGHRTQMVLRHRGMPIGLCWPHRTSHGRGDAAGRPKRLGSDQGIARMQ